MKIVLAVTGSVAIYKACSLTRLLRRQGHEVQVIMTASAQEFISPSLFEALSGVPVPATAASKDGYAHLDVGKCDIFLVAPATAGTIAKLANGLADDIIGAAYLATTGRVVIAPAMNVRMLQHPATQSNIDTLRQRGATIIEPGAGDLACGENGEGRLAALDTILAEVQAN